MSSDVEHAAVLERFRSELQRGIPTYGAARIGVREDELQALDAALRALRRGGGEDLRAEVERLNAIVNSPQSDDFLRAVSTEAEHQRQRWANSHDAGKTAPDWFWLIGYLAGKALHCVMYGLDEKAEHHVITTAAACANWHRAMRGATDMRPGIDGEAALAPAPAGRDEQ
jgi:hypothetical protein